MANNKEAQVACKLTSPELRIRKETTIASLRHQILDKKELTNGYAYKFYGTNDVLDVLNEFIKTERLCCSFFIFTISASGDKSEAWLSLTGPKGAKEFMTNELGL
ncbi:hypothetical protein [Niabella beijingensis]|uniref:hypothetical protein n=1 Tax=Niabella beijingensis TaxID=2872700 RepID=UPI001CC00941|nr:hypothetical protein [Niabella beijingensis]MBZ4188922.1 hypothetical protein [Niabella beijingensis]